MIIKCISVPHHELPPALSTNYANYIQKPLWCFDKTFHNSFQWSNLFQYLFTERSCDSQQKWYLLSPFTITAEKIHHWLILTWLSHWGLIWSWLLSIQYEPCMCVCVCVWWAHLWLWVCARPYVFAEEKTRHSFSSCPHLLPIHVKNQSRVKTCLNFSRLCDYGVREGLTDLCATEASPRHLACHARLVRWRLPVKRLWVGGAARDPTERQMGH